MTILLTHTIQKQRMCQIIYKGISKIVSLVFSNHLVANTGKCHLFTSSKTLVDTLISNTEILNKEKVKLLGLNLEGGLNFDFHVNVLLKKASKKYHDLARVRNYMIKKKRPILMNAFITSQFSCRDLVWMSHNRAINNGINKIQKNL